MIQQINTIDDVKQFAKDLVAEGCNFHCDDDFNDYTYSPEEAALRNNLMKQSFKVCEKEGVDIYNLMLQSFAVNPSVESAKQFLKDNGYYTENLWHINDVKNKYNCSDNQAQTVLNDVLNGEWFTGEVNASIDITAEAYYLEKRKPKLFYISGYYKEDGQQFENYIVSELEEELNDEEDEKIFFYDLNEKNIEKHMKLGNKTWLDFVITSYEEII